MMLKLNSTTLIKNIEITNQHLQQAGSALVDTWSSTFKLGGDILATSKSVVEAVQFGYNDYKTVCSKVVGNLPILAIGATVGLVLFPTTYVVLANVATCFVSYPIASLTAQGICNFFIRTKGAENILDTISSAGDVLSKGVKVGTELYHASEKAINTVTIALKSCMLQGSDHDSEATSDEVNIDEYKINANQHAISSVGDSLSDINTEPEGYDLISHTDVYKAVNELSGTIVGAS